jgi:hypothetical protein
MFEGVSAMYTVKQIIKEKELSFYKNFSYAFLSAALLLQSNKMVELWANLPHLSNDIAIDEKGNTASHLAVQNSWPKATEVLLNRGASPGSINYEDFSVETLARNVYREYAHKVAMSESYSGAATPLNRETAEKFAQAKQVLDVLDKYKYADYI